MKHFIEFVHGIRDKVCLEKKTSSTSGLLYISAVFPYLLLIIPVFGLCFALYIGRLDFAVRGLVVVIPSELAALFLLRYNNNQLSTLNPCFEIKISSKILPKIFMILFITSGIILAWTSVRPWYYFLFVLMIIICILFQILSTNINKTLILGEIILTNLSLIFGVVLKYPLYFGGTDTIPHIFFSKITSISGHVIPLDLDTTYASFPLYHIFVAIGGDILNLDTKTALFLLTSLSFILVVPIIFLLFRNIIREPRILLLTCLCFSLSSTVVFYGTYVVTRALAFILFMIILYLITCASTKAQSVKYNLLAVILAIALIATHQVSLPQFVILLLLFVICESMCNVKIINRIFLLSLIILFLGYWFFSSAGIFVEALINSRISSVHLEALVIKSTVGIGNEYSYLLSNISVIISLFFILIGIAYLLSQKDMIKYGSVFALFGLVTGFIYIPNPLQTLWDVMILFRTDRFLLFISPILALLMATGIYIIYNNLLLKNRSNVMSSIIIVSILVVFSFFTICYENASDCDDFPWTTSHNYFNDQEMQGSTFIKEYVPEGSSLTSDEQFQRFLDIPYFSLTEQLSLPYFKSNTISSVEELVNNNGYIAFRYGEFYRYGLSFLNKPDRLNYIYKFNQKNNACLEDSLKQKDTVYNNKGLILYS